MHKPKTHLRKASDEERAEAAQTEIDEGGLYGSLVGELNWIACNTRPDIAIAVSELGRHRAAPTKDHWNAARHLLRYLAGTRHLGITYGRPSTHERIGSEIIGFSDSDYASDPDTRRSRTGYVFILNGGAVSWQSKLQPTVAVSTTEAEYMASAFAAREAIWLGWLLREIWCKADKPIRLLVDNAGAEALAKNPIVSDRSKHFDVQFHFIREKVEEGELLVEHIPTDKQAADGLTKPLDRIAFERCRGFIGMHEPAAAQTTTPRGRVLEESD